MVQVFNTKCQYDSIIRCDILNQLGVLLDFKEKIMYWDDAEVAMHWYVPMERDYAMVSTTDTTVYTTNLTE